MRSISRAAANEVTDKGTVNPGAVLANRGHRVDELHTRPYARGGLVAI